MKKILLLVSVLTLAGCATSQGFNREALKSKIGVNPLVSDSDVNQSSNLKAKLKMPFKVGVYFQEPVVNTGKEWTWTNEDKQKVIKALDKFKGREVSQVSVISPSVTSGKDLKSLRQTASQQGADALLVVSGVSDLDYYSNNWAYSYVLLFPAAFAPGSVSEVLFISRAAMYDVKTQFLYFAAESESLNQRTYPLVFRQDTNLTLNAKDESMKGLAEELTKRLDNSIDNFKK